MSQSCTVCHHPDRVAIDTQLVTGAAKRRIAAQFELSETAVRRHAASHLPQQLQLAQDAQDVADAGRLLGQVLELNGRGLAILDKAEAAGDLRTALLGIREARSTLELMFRLQGMLADRARAEAIVAVQVDPYASLSDAELEARISTLQAREERDQFERPVSWSPVAAPIEADEDLVDELEADVDEAVSEAPAVPKPAPAPAPVPRPTGSRYVSEAVQRRLLESQVRRRDVPLFDDRGRRRP